MKKQPRIIRHRITSGAQKKDGKIRPEHAVNDGKIFSWNDPPVTGHPGEAFGCRCWAEAYEPNSAGGKRVWVEIHNSQKITIYYTNGVSETRIGGSLAWRNNNPGNIRTGTFSAAHGAIGDNNGFAVFSDRETGYAASSSLLRTTTYLSLTVSEAIARRSPNVENNTEALQDAIIRDSGISKDKLIRDLSEIEFHVLLDSIHQFEGWVEGVVEIKQKNT